MNILCFSGSPRQNGNSTILLNYFINGVNQNSAVVEIINPYKTNIEFCKGCLRCNILKKCSIDSDEWQNLSKKILKADIIVFASPVYFHHLTAPLKIILDRFRSFINVKITSDGLNHTPWTKWKKDFVLILTMGSSDVADAQPIIDLFHFMCKILGEENKLHVITANRMVTPNQIEKDEEFIAALYKKLGLNKDFVKKDYEKYQYIKKKAYELGIFLTQKKVSI